MDEKTTAEVDKRTPWYASLLLLSVTFLALSVFPVRRYLMDLTHWPLKNVRAQVAPFFWPHDPFSKKEWTDAPHGQRYRYVNDLLDKDLIGMTNVDIADLLSGDPSQEMCRVKYDGNNLWYVLVIEFEDDVVSGVGVRMAYFDP